MLFDPTLRYGIQEQSDGKSVVIFPHAQMVKLFSYLLAACKRVEHSLQLEWLEGDADYSLNTILKTT